MNDGSIQDRSVSNVHTEYTQTGHAFVVIATEDDCEENSDYENDALPKSISEISNTNLICYYKPLISTYRHEVTISKKRLRSFSMKTSANVTVKLTKIDNTPGGGSTIIDTSDKQYASSTIAGFTCMYEYGVFDQVTNLRECLQQDLEMVKYLLPREAYTKLKENTKFWINKTITFGTKAEPVVGRGI